MNFRAQSCMCSKVQDRIRAIAIWFVDVNVPSTAEDYVSTTQGGILQQTDESWSTDTFTRVCA